MGATTLPCLQAGPTLSSIPIAYWSGLFSYYISRSHKFKSKFHILTIAPNRDTELEIQ